MPAAPSGASSAAFVIRIPSSTAASGQFARPQYVSPSTQSLQIAVTGEATPVVANLTPASPNCTPASGSKPLTCTVSVTAPVGTDTFTVAMYAQQNASGYVLSKGSVTATITANQSTPVNVVTQGVISAIQLVLGGPAPAYGKPSKIPLTVNVKDASGNVIIAPGNYATPIALHDSDAKYTTLSTTSLTAPSASVTVSYNGGPLSSATISAAASGIPATRITNAVFQPIGFRNYAIPTASSGTYIMTAGPDGNLWFAERDKSKIGRITPGGVTTEFTLPTLGSGPTGITSGPDGNLWFTEKFNSKIGRITPAGTIAEVVVPTSGSNPLYITTGPDHNLWFSEYYGNKIARITPAGAFTEFPVPTVNAFPQGITTGPDGNIWFTEFLGDKIGRITTGGTITEFAVPTASSSPLEIAPGSDGNLWFTEYNANKIGRITPGGAITEYVVPTANSQPGLIGPGPNGNLWFTEYTGNKLGEITTGGAFTEVPITTANSQPSGLALGPDGNLWFVETGANAIGVYVP